MRARRRAPWRWLRIIEQLHKRAFSGNYPDADQLDRVVRIVIGLGYCGRGAVG
ncbi:MAG: hypothetical protein ACR2L9_10390 [Solirubrobacteraceae bacterium]